MKKSAPSKKAIPALPKVFADNLAQLLEREKSRSGSLPWYLRYTDPAIQFFGSIWFLWINVIVFAIWIALNTGVIGFGTKFDPYPFEFLTLSVSLEAIVLSVVVLIAQNKLQNESDERAQLDLHVNLLAERESTLILKKLARIEEHFKIHIGPVEKKHVQDLIEETDPCRLAELIHEQHLVRK